MSGNEDYRQDVQAKTTKTIQIALTPQSMLEQMFPNAPKKADTVDCFRSLTPNMSIYMVVEKCGRADEETGSGLYIFVWHLRDGSTVAIGTPSQKEFTTLRTWNRRERVFRFWLRSDNC